MDEVEELPRRGGGRGPPPAALNAAAAAKTLKRGVATSVD